MYLLLLLHTYINNQPTTIGAAILVAKGPVADKWKLTYKQTSSIKAVRGSGNSITLYLHVYMYYILYIIVTYYIYYYI